MARGAACGFEKGAKMGMKSDFGRPDATALERLLQAGGRVRRLVPEPQPLLSRIPSLGPVAARSQSASATLESVGTYGPPDIGEHTGIVLGDNIDLRIFPSGWKHAYAVWEPDANGPLRSVRIFDAYGAPAHAIFLRPESDADAFERLVDALGASDDGAPAIERAAPSVERPDAGIDVAAYRAAYAAMVDTHDFFMLLRRFGLAREQGLRLAGDVYAVEVARDAHRDIFAAAARGRIPLMLFVASDGIVQISSGPVSAPTFAAGRCRLGDERYSLELREDAVARVWAVSKPTSLGIVTSLELYGSDGVLGLQLFGERHAGASELPDWTRAIGELRPAVAMP